MTALRLPIAGLVVDPSPFNGQVPPGGLAGAGDFTNGTALGIRPTWQGGPYPLGALAALELPLPRAYNESVGFRRGARPLPAVSSSFGSVVRSATHVTSRVQAVNYARAGYHAARRLADTNPAEREAWQRVAQFYAFVHDLDSWVQSRVDVVFDEPLRDRYVNDLRQKLAFADAESAKLRPAPSAKLRPAPSAPLPPRSTPLPSTATEIVPMSAPIPDAPGVAPRKPLPIAAIAGIAGAILIVIGIMATRKRGSDLGDLPATDAP